VPFEIIEAFLLLASATTVLGIEVEVSVMAVFDLALSLAVLKVESETLGHFSWGAFALAGVAVPDLWLGCLVWSGCAVLWLALNGSRGWVPVFVCCR